MPLFFTFIVFHTIHYRTWQDIITRCTVRLGPADVLYVESEVFWGSYHIAVKRLGQAGILTSKLVVF